MLFCRKFFQEYQQRVKQSLDLGPNCLQSLSADDTGKQKVNKSVLLHPLMHLLLLMYNKTV